MFSIQFQVLRSIPTVVRVFCYINDYCGFWYVVSSYLLLKPQRVELHFMNRCMVSPKGQCLACRFSPVSALCSVNHLVLVMLESSRFLRNWGPHLIPRIGKKHRHWSGMILQSCRNRKTYQLFDSAIKGKFTKKSYLLLSSLWNVKHRNLIL